MYFKLALKNVKKSYKDYFVYFLTLTISIALFYVFNSFDVQQEQLLLNAEETMAFNSLMMVMFYLSIFVTFVFGFLILYANNYLLKRRKQEIALYTLLGMKKRKIGIILLFETLIVGFVSLFFGIGLGILLSQGVVVFTGYLINIDINYKFMISTQAINITVISFSLIFIIVSLFNNISNSKAKLIDLFSARKTNEKIRVNNPIFMSVIMIVSLSVLAYAYYLAQIPLNLIILFPIIIAMGSLATFGIFYALSYWLVAIAQRVKSYYYKDLNTFSTRQISSKINSTYKMLAVVSLMMLISFGALATAFNITAIIESMVDKGVQYDATVVLSSLSYEENDRLMNGSKLKETLDYSELRLLSTSMRTFDFNHDELLFDSKGSHTFEFVNAEVILLDVDDYNRLRKEQNLSEITLEDYQTVYIRNFNDFISTAEKNDNFFSSDTVTVNDVPLKLLENTSQEVTISNDGTVYSLIFVTNRNTINEVVSNIEEDNNNEYISVYNFNYGDSLDSVETTTMIKEGIRDNIRDYEVFGTHISTKSDTLFQLKSMTLLMTFIGLYMGLTFLVVSVMVIALQLLSEASDNYERYLLLDKIGVSRKLQKRAIFKQNLIYFALPLTVGLIHSYFGIKAVNVNLALSGLRTDNYLVILGAIGILVFIYAVYFLITYFSSVRMIFDRK